MECVTCEGSGDNYLDIPKCNCKYVHQCKMSIDEAILITIDCTGINIESFNAKGLADKVKRKVLFNWLVMWGIKIIMLQETHSTVVTETLWKTQWSGMVFMCQGTSNSRGPGIPIHRIISLKLYICKTDLNGHFIIIYFNIDGCK